MFIDENRTTYNAADLAYYTDLDKDFLAELSDASYHTISVSRRYKFIVLISASTYGDSLVEMANAKAIDKFAEDYPDLRLSTTYHMWENALLLDFEVLALMDDEDKARIIDLVNMTNEHGVWDDDIYNQLADEWWNEYAVEEILNLGYEFTDVQLAEWSERVRSDGMIWVEEEGYLDVIEAREVADYVIANY